MKVTINQEGHDLNWYNLQKFLQRHYDECKEYPCALFIHTSLEQTAVILRDRLAQETKIPKFQICIRGGGDTDDWELISYIGVTLVQAP